jgi:hypothetical protein
MTRARDLLGFVLTGAGTRDGVDAGWMEIEGVALVSVARGAVLRSGGWICEAGATACEYLGRVSPSLERSSFLKRPVRKQWTKQRVYGWEMCYGR